MSPEGTALLTGILGLLTPLVVAFLSQPYWSSQTKQIVAVVTAAIVGIITAVTSGLPVNLTNVIELVGLAVGASQAAYTFLWRPSGVAPAIERNTQIAPSPQAAHDDVLVVLDEV